MNNSSNQSTNRSLCLGYEYINSWISGPTIWIVAITHGNEIAGLKIFEQLKKNITIKNGTIILIPSNIDAYQSYIKQHDPLSFRFIDHDMNRIWDDSYIEWSSEYKRRNELKAILLECDIIIDIHSVSKWDDVLGIADPISLKDAIGWMDTEKILMQSENDNSMTAWCTRQGKISFGLEAGNHISEQGVKNGIRNIENMLVYFGLMDGSIEKFFPSPDALMFLEEIKVSSDNFKYARDFESFNVLSINEIIAYDGWNEIKNPYPYAVIYWLVTQRPEKWKSAWFLFRK